MESFGRLKKKGKELLKRAKPSNLPSYSYPTLDPRAPTIRLLKIIHGQSEGIGPDSLLKCGMTVAYVGQPDNLASQAYTAISYHWGRPGSIPRETNRSILIDGCPLQVSDIVHDILLACAKPEEDVLIWLDAICINQSNPLEKGSQVDRMRSIYAAAQSVLVSLGPHRSLDAEADCQSRCLHLSQGTLDESQYEMMISDLTSHPWFRRRWAIQEATYAREVRVLLHGSSVSPTTLLPLFEKYLEIGRERSRAAWVRQTLPLLQATVATSFEPSLHLPDVLHLYRGWGASLELDAVYALLGLSRRSHFAHNFKIDYSLSRATLFQRIARYYIQHTRSLAFLTYRSRAQTRHNMENPYAHSTWENRGSWEIRATWVVDWIHTDPVIGCLKSVEPMTYREDFEFASVKSSFDSPELSVSGWKIATLTSIFPDNSVEAVPTTNLGANPYLSGWDWQEISPYLISVSSHLADPSGTTFLKENDELWVLGGTTGPAFLRPSPHIRPGPPSSRTYTLIVLQHTEYPFLPFLKAPMGDTLEFVASQKPDAASSSWHRMVWYLRSQGTELADIKLY